MNTPEARRPPLETADSSSSYVASAPLPDGLLSWLQPWRAPEDCLAGGLSLSRSAEVLLKNVEAARQASMQQLYGLRDSRGTTVGSHTPRTDRDGRHGTSGRSSLAMKSVSAQRRSHVGITLMDIASCPSSRRSSIFLPDAVSPVSMKMSAAGAAEFPGTKSSSPSSRWDGEEHNSVRLSPGGATPLMSTPSVTPVIVSSRSPAGCREDRHRTSATAREGSASPPPRSTTVEAKGADAGLLAPTVHVAQPAARAATEPVSEARQGSVPAIPRFAQFMRDKEVLLKVLESDPLPPPRRSRSHEATPPPLALPVEMTQPRIAEEEEEDGHSPPHPMNGDRTARPPQRRASAPFSDLASHDDRQVLAFPRLQMESLERSGLLDSGEVIGTYSVQSESDNDDAGHAMHDAEEDSWLARPASVGTPEAEICEEAYSDEDKDAPEFDDELNASEHNFGEGGHLTCVPGDTLNNRYVLMKQLGVGRSSRVWMAVDLEQCSVARRHLIRAVGESLVRELSKPNEKPLFVAIKVFRCGDMYSACARYEVKVLNYINERLKVQSVQKHFTLGNRSGNVSTAQSPARARSGGSGLSSSSSSPGAPPRSSSFTSASATQQTLAEGISVARAKASFTVEGDHGTHHCIVMDVLGTGVDAAINETNLRGMPLPVVRSILTSAIQGLATLASMSIIHTDLKPENLLFVDLDHKTAEEMSVFQASHFGMELQGGLWTGFTHRRLAIPDYTHATPVGSAASSPGAAPRSESEQKKRVVYTVQVADLGLSFVVPHALRSGVTQLMALGGPDIVAQKPAEQVAAIRAYYTSHEDGDGDGVHSAHDNATPALASTSSCSPDGVDRDGGGGASAAPPLCLTSLTSSHSAHAHTASAPTPVQVERVSVFHIPGDAQNRRGGGDMGSGSGEVASIARLADSISSLESDTDLPGREVARSHSTADPRFSHGAVAASYDRQRGLSSVLVSQGDNDSVEVEETSLSPQSPTNGEEEEEHDVVFVPITAEPRTVLQTASYHSPPTASLPPTREPASAHTADHAPRQPRMMARRHRLGDHSGSGSGMTLTTAPVNPARLSTMYSCIVAPPTELEMDILEQQNYSRGATVQSREYRSPEVLLGDFFLPSCDVWSVGCIAYELVVGRFLMDPAAEYNETMNVLIEMERDRRRDQLRRARQRGSLRRSTGVGSVDGGSSPASLSISGRVSKWLGGLRGTGGHSDLGDSFGRNSSAAHVPLPQRQRHTSDYIEEILSQSHTESEGEEEGGGANVTTTSENLNWIDGIEDGKSRSSRGSPAASPSDTGGKTAYDAVLEKGCRPSGGGRVTGAEGHHVLHSDGSEEEEESVILNSEEEEEVLMAVQGVYFDEYEKDMDVFHLKTMMRLVGPPPLGYLQREPEGLFVRDFFDEKGVFLFYDDQAAEEKEYGIDQIRALLESERQRLRQPSSLPTVLVAEESAPPVSYDSLFQPSHATQSSASTKTSPAMGPTAAGPPPVLLQSPDSANLSCGAESLRSGSVTPSVLSLAAEGYTPLSAANYPVITPAWRRLQREIRQKMPAEAEALAFETFLRQALQWDPAMRADAASLLHSQWLTAFGELATE